MEIIKTRNKARVPSQLIVNINASDLKRFKDVLSTFLKNNNCDTVLWFSTNAKRHRSQGSKVFGVSGYIFAPLRPPPP